MILTKKQYQILATIGNFKEKKPLTIAEIIKRLPFKPSRQSFRFSRKALLNKGLIKEVSIKDVCEELPHIEGCRGQEKLTKYLVLTPLGLHVINGEKKLQRFVFSEEEDAFFEEMRNAVPLFEDTEVHEWQKK